MSAAEGIDGEDTQIENFATENFSAEKIANDSLERQQLAAHLRKIYSAPREKWPAPELDPGVEHAELGLPPSPPTGSPGRKPDTPQQQALGKMLFFDPRLSRSREISCASCHNPDLGWADGLPVAIGRGRRQLRRNTPSVLNTAHLPHFFWDGRADSYEKQALAAITNADEMNSTTELVVERLSRVQTYVRLFKEAYGDGKISIENVLHALAAFQRTLHSPGTSDFDRFLKGQKNAMSDAAIRGLHLFRTSARCMNCHNGPLLTDNQFHDLGLSFFGRSRQDLGRYEATGKASDSGKFKTPGLRNVTKTAPYMHNGLFTLDGVLRLYNAGMPTLRQNENQRDDPLFPKKDPLLRPLGLSQQELEDLKAFLQSLEDPPRKVPHGQFPPLRDDEE